MQGREPSQGKGEEAGKGKLSRHTNTCPLLVGKYAVLVSMGRLMVVGYRNYVDLAADVKDHRTRARIAFAIMASNPKHHRRWRTLRLFEVQLLGAPSVTDFDLVEIYRNACGIGFSISGQVSRQRSALSIL